MSHMLLKPPPLRPGDTIAIIATADRPRGPGEVQRAAALVARLGFEPLVYDGFGERYSAWSAPDAVRAATFMRAWNDPRVRAIWLLRGGWGAARLLPLLDYHAIAQCPKLLIANNEASSLLVAIHQRTGLATLHGPELARGKLDAPTREWLLRLLTSSDPPGLVPTRQTDPFDFTTIPLTLVEGCATGRLLGGHLTELASLLGTPDAPNCAGRLLFIALPSDPPYVLERHLTALRLAGLFHQCAGLILSDYVGTPDLHKSVTLTREEAVRYGVEGVRCPTCAEVQIGMDAFTAALPLGVEAVLDATNRTLVVTESMVAQ